MQGELIKAAMNRDESACHTLFNSWFDRAYRVSKSICGGRAPAEDAVQEALLRFWRAFPRLKDLDKAERYFMRVVANEARRMRTRKIACSETPFLEGIESELAYGNPAEDNELAYDLGKAVLSLPEKLRTAVQIKYYGGFTEAETAEMLGVSLASVKMRLSRGRQKLREILEHDGYDVIGGDSHE